MTPHRMTSMERVLTSLRHQEPDRVPFFLLLTMHGAREVGLSIQDYFSSAENLVEGQIRLLSRYRHDCLYAFFYASLEMEAWGGETIFRDNGPPNAGAPFLQTSDSIKRLEPPRVKESTCLHRVLRAIEQFKIRARGETPIIGVVLSPFSAPVMQLGFERYLDLMYEQPELLDRLLRINEEFCVEWANAQIEAGATAICYFDPVSSPTIIPHELYMRTGFLVAQRTLARIRGPVAIHFASGRSLPLVDTVQQSGAVMIGVSAEDSISELKRACRGKLTILGNLNGIAMSRWTQSDADKTVRQLMNQAGPGGGFILSDNHGEIPFQVPDDVLLALSSAVHRWGTYPLDVETMNV